MPTEAALQDDFSGGIWRSSESQRSPMNSAYDIVNGVVGDDLSVYRRGTTVKVADAGAPVGNLAHMNLPVGKRVLVGGTELSHGLRVLHGVELRPAIAGTYGPSPVARMIAVGGLSAYPVAAVGNAAFVLYAGAQATVPSAASYTTGTVSLTAGSRSVVGTGVTWTANEVMPGALLSTTQAAAPIAHLNAGSSNTLTLAEPWPGVTNATASYQISQFRHVGLTGTPSSSPTYLAAVGTPPRLVVCKGSTVSFSARGTYLSFDPTDYHTLPSDAVVIGAQGVGDSTILFTTRGVWAISNMSYDLTDDYGNVQHRVDQVNPDLILLGDTGLQTWRGAFVVPAHDDVYLYALGGDPTPISQGIRPLYRDYVAAGAIPGVASIYRGHYILPLVTRTGAPVDTLVCRLDGSQPAWTRWEGHAAARAYSAGQGADAKLIAGTGSTVSDLSGVFNRQSKATDANNTQPVLTVITRDFSARAQQVTLWKALRARYELTETDDSIGWLGCEYVVGSSWRETEVSGQESDGTRPTRFPVGKRQQAIKFRLKSQGAVTSVVLRSLEVMFSRSNRT